MRVEPKPAYFDAASRSYAARGEAWPWSWLRRREEAAVFDLLGPVRGCEILELGCGAGYYTRRLISRGGARHVVAVDIAPGMVRQLPAEGVTGIVGDACAVELDRKFPVILSAGLLEFLEDPAALFQNARRHAMPGARLVVLAPGRGFFGALYRLYHRSHRVEARLFAEGDIRRLAGQSGWRIAQVRKVWPFALVVEARNSP